MFCKNCGNKIEDGIVFCPECGASIANDVESNDYAKNENTYQTENNQPERVRRQINTASETSYNQNIPSGKPKGGMNKKVVIAVSAVAAVGICAGAAALIIGNSKPGYSTPKEHFEYVMGKTIDDTSLLTSNMITGFKNGMSLDNKSSVELALSDDAKEYISLAGDEAAEYLDWIEKVGLTTEMSYDEDKIGETISLSINDTHITDMDAVFAGEDMYLKLSDVMDKYICVPMDDSVDSELAMLQEIVDIIPDSQTANSLVSKYAKGMVSRIGDVKETKKTINGDDISQELTVLTVTLDAETAADMVLWTLEEAREDKELETIIKDASEMSGTDADDVYEEFIDTIDEGIEFFEDLDNFDETISIDIDFYVNDSDELVGGAFEYEGVETVVYTVTDKGNYETFAEVDSWGEGFTLEGSGTEQNGKLSGSYDLEINSDYTDFDISFEIENLDKKLYKQGIMNGSVEFEIPELPDDVIDSFASSLLSKLSIRIESSTTDINHMNGVLKLKIGDTDLVSLKLDTELGNGKEVTVPKDYITEDDYDSYEFMEEISGNIIETLSKKLKEAGAPKSLLKMITSGY